jgi:hypothetical protein
VAGSASRRPGCAHREAQYPPSASRESVLGEGLIAQPVVLDAAPRAPVGHANTWYSRLFRAGTWHRARPGRIIPSPRLPHCAVRPSSPVLQTCPSHVSPDNPMTMPGTLSRPQTSNSVASVNQAPSRSERLAERSSRIRFRIVGVAQSRRRAVNRQHPNLLSPPPSVCLHPAFFDVTAGRLLGQETGDSATCGRV